MVGVGVGTLPPTVNGIEMTPAFVPSLATATN
jgi:hypothetical protein